MYFSNKIGSHQSGDSRLFVFYSIDTWASDDLSLICKGRIDRSFIHHQKWTLARSGQISLSLILKLQVNYHKLQVSFLRIIWYIVAGIMPCRLGKGHWSKPFPCWYKIYRGLPNVWISMCRDARQSTVEIPGLYLEFKSFQVSCQVFSKFYQSVYFTWFLCYARLILMASVSLSTWCSMDHIWP